MKPSQQQSLRAARPRAGGWLPCGLLTVAMLSAMGVVSACAASSEVTSSSPRPHVLVILIDALRADAVGAYGYPLPTTPAIDALAEQGIVFTSAFSQSTWTKPAIATLFTSLYPSQHGLDRVGFQEGETFRSDVLGEERVTLAEAFQAGGYATMAVINQVHLKEQFGFAQGFESFEAVRGVGAFKLNEKLLTLLRSRDERPFFAYLHYLDVHWPYTSRLEGREEEFGNTGMQSEPPQKGSRVEEWVAGVNQPQDLAALRARYDQEVAFADAAVGALMEGLRDLGVEQDTLVVVTSDHGEGFMERGLLLHGYAPYDEMARVPLVVRLPPAHQIQESRLDDPVGLIDVMPTLLDLAGLPPAEQAVGRTLVPLLRGESEEPVPVFIESADALAVRGPRFKLIHFLDGRSEFYDLQRDPAEGSPIEGPCAGRCAELAALLETYQRTVGGTDAGAAGESMALDPDELEDLRALGYL